MPELNVIPESAPTNPHRLPTTISPQKDRQIANRPQLMWTIVALSLVAAVRVLAAMGDLAIDEIWSLWFVRHVLHRFVDIIGLRHDNNHLLNTMILYIIGPDAAGIVYRIPAVCASVTAVWVAGKIASRHGGFRSELTAWIFVGGSYVMILYGSEARGYSYAVLFAYLSWLFLLRLNQHHRRSDAVLFAICACLGFLAHLTFLYCYAGFCVWTIAKWIRRPNWILPLSHLFPCLFAFLLYLFFIRGMAVGGGPATSLTAAIISTLSIIAGGPLSGDGAVAVSMIVLLMIGFGLVHAWRTDKPLAVFYLMTIIVAPAAVLLLTGHALVYPRYFMIPIAFALLLISDAISSWKPTRLADRTVQIVIIAAYLTGNIWWTARLLDHGRGDYSQAMTWIASQSELRPPTVQTDHDFRNALVFDYYANQLWPQGSKLMYVQQVEVPTQGTDWLILHNFDEDDPYPNTFADRHGNPYQLERTFRHHSLTGWNWWIYRRVVTRTRSAKP